MYKIVFFTKVMRGRMFLQERCIKEMESQAGRLKKDSAIDKGGFV